MNLRIDISEIILNGIQFSPNQAFEFLLALERELMQQQLVSSASADSSARQIDHHQFDARPDASPRELASGIASSIRGSVKTCDLRHEANQ